MNGGVSAHGWLGVLQVGAACGIVAGAIAPNAPAAFGAGLVAAFLGGFAFLPWFLGGDVLQAAAMAGVAAAVALGVRLLLERTRVTSMVLAMVGLVLVVGGLWWVTFPALTQSANGRDMPTLLDTLRTRPVVGQQWSDGTLFRAVVIEMREGAPYYEAFRRGFLDNGFTRHAPTNVMQVRLPTLFYLWAMLPDWPASLVWSLLAVASVASVACVGIAREVVDPTLGLAGAAAIGAYTMASAQSPNNVASFELWGGLIAVVVLFAYLRSLGSAHHRTWALVAAVVAVSAFSIRELMIFLPLAGLIAAWFAPAEERRFDLAVWAVALGSCIALWAAHVLAASRITLSVSGGVASTWLGGGGVEYMLRGLTYNKLFMSAPWVPFALAALGVIGALAQRTPQARAFAAFAVVAPVVGFLFVGNAAISRDLVLGQTVNYWGAIVMPMLIALAPASFAFLPTLRLAPRTSAPAVQRLTEPAASL